jgi:hypothetical protein
VAVRLAEVEPIEGWPGLGMLVKGPHAAREGVPEFGKGVR